MTVTTGMHDRAQAGEVVVATGWYLDSEGGLSRVDAYDLTHSNTVGHPGHHVWDGRTANGRTASWKPDGTTDDSERPYLIARVNTWYDAPIPGDLPPETLVEIESGEPGYTVRRATHVERARRKVYRRWRLIRDDVRQDAVDASTGRRQSSPSGRYQPGYTEFPPGFRDAVHSFGHPDPQPQPGETWLVDLPTSARGDLDTRTVDEVGTHVVWLSGDVYLRKYVHFVQRQEKAPPEGVTVVRRGDRVRFEDGHHVVEGTVAAVPTITLSGCITHTGTVSRRGADVSVELDAAEAGGEAW